MNDSEIDELLVLPTVEALIAATVSEDGTQIGAAVQMISASTEHAHLIAVAIGLAQVAGPNAAAVWQRLGEEISGSISAYVEMVDLIYRHAVAGTATEDEVRRQWALCDHPMRIAAIIELMSMAAMARHYRWQSNK
jgi:hypothetical protein